MVDVLKLHLWLNAQFFTFDKTLLLISLIDNKQPGISKLFTFTKSSFHQMCLAHTSLPGNSNLSQNLYYYQVFCTLNFFGMNWCNYCPKKSNSSWCFDRWKQLFKKVIKIKNKQFLIHIHMYIYPQFFDKS